MSLFFATTSFAQRDIIFKRDSTEIRCRILKESATNYYYAFVDSNNKKVKAAIAKSMVDSVKRNQYDADITKIKIVQEEKVNSFQYTLAIGLNIGNLLEFNPPSGNDKKTFSLTASVDAGLNYAKEGSPFGMTNELHYLLGLQKPGLGSSGPIQRVSDDVSTLHDFSIGFGKKSKWHFNLIAKTATSFFTVYDGDYFKDVTGLGQIQGFLSPYEVILSPGIRFSPNAFFRLSLSPYSVKLYGVKNSQIANTGLFTKDSDGDGAYDRFEYTRLGAGLNIWYDRRIKNRLDMQYRLGLSSDYLEKVGKNGLLDGLFITKIKIYKDLYLTHRATLKGNLGGNILRPWYSQTILLSYAKSF